MLLEFPSRLAALPAAVMQLARSSLGDNLRNRNGEAAQPVTLMKEQTALQILATLTKIMTRNNHNESDEGFSAARTLFMNCSIA